MKIIKDEPKFRKVSIVLETPQEVDILYNIVCGLMFDQESFGHNITFNYILEHLRRGGDYIEGSLFDFLNNIKTQI